MHDLDMTHTDDICAIEIAPMRDVSDPPRIVTIRPAKPDETPDLWCVIARLRSGAGCVLKDERDRSSALAYAEAVRETLRARSVSPLPAIIAV